MATLQLPVSKSIPSSLTSLTLTNAKKPTQLSTIEVRRNKLSNQIWQQIQLAGAKAKGEAFAPMRTRNVKDKLTGERRTVEQPKRIKQWWFTDADGSIFLQIRYGAKLIEVSKGKNAIALANEDELIPALNLIKQAVEGGELDKEIEVRCASLRLNFKY